ncbi:MAG: diguanylate cyclase domain-containing protein [Actinomycetota bacterium]
MSSEPAYRGEPATPPKALRDRLRVAEVQVFEARARYEALLAQLPVAIYTYSPNLDGPTYYMSPFIEELLGVPPDVFLENDEIWDELIHPDDRERARVEYESYLRTGAPDGGEYRYIRPDGRIVWVYDRSSTIRDPDGSALYIQGVMYDITPTKEAELKMQHLAHHDALTGLPNRALFEEHLELALARARRDSLAVAVLFMDLDEFKPINDLHGHGVGDEVLKQIAARLRSGVRDADLVARTGGDEFLVLLADLAPGEEGENAQGVIGSVVRRLDAVLEAPLGLRVGELVVRASVGWSVYPFDARDARGLFRRADQEMYRRKRERPRPTTLSRHPDDGR